MKADNIIKLNVPADKFGEILIWALRYSLGRRTYAVSDTCNFIKHLIPKLEDYTIYYMVRDIEEYGGYKRSNFDQHCYGDACDFQEWVSLHRALCDEIIKRKENGDERFANTPNCEVHF